MDKKFRTMKNWLAILLVALATSGLMASLLNVGKALASVSWNG